MTLRSRFACILMLAVLVSFALPAHAQFTTVTATNIQRGDGLPLALGTMCWLGTSNAGQPIGYRAGSSVQAITSPICRDIINGAVQTTYKGSTIGVLKVADTTLTTPVNVCYKVSVVDSATGKVVLGSYAGTTSGYDCVQPSGTTWSFDTYTPAGTPNVVQVAGPQGPQGPPGLTFNASSNIAFTGNNTHIGAEDFRLINNVYYTSPAIDGGVYADECAAINASKAFAISKGWNAVHVISGWPGTQHCANPMFDSSWFNFAGAATFTAVIELHPSNTIQHDIGIVVPASVTLWGGSNGGVGVGATIQATSAFYAQVPVPPAVVQFGAPHGTTFTGSTPPEGVWLSHININGRPSGAAAGSYTPVACLLNQYAQENSGAEFIFFDGCITGLDLENGGTLNGALNSGSYKHLRFNFDGINSANAHCITTGGTTANLGAIRAIEDYSCNLSGDVVQPTTAITIDSESTSLVDGHIEGFVNGVVIGANHPARNFSLDRLSVVSFAGNPMSNAVLISATNTSSGTVKNVKGGGSISGLKLLTNSLTGETPIDGSTSNAVVTSYAWPAGITPISSLGDATASATANMNNFGLTLVGGAAQSATAFKVQGNASNATANTLAQFIALGANEKSFTASNPISLISHAINGQLQFTPVAVATAGGSVSSPGFLLQGNCYNGTGGSPDNYTVGVAYAGGTNPTGTFSWTRTGGCGGAITFDVSNFSRVKAAAFLSSSASAAAAGQVRLASADTINFRNNAGTADISLAHNTSDQLTYGGSITPQNASATPTLNRAVCWKTVSTLGFCSTQPDSTGACTCN